MTRDLIYLDSINYDKYNNVPISIQHKILCKKLTLEDNEGTQSVIERWKDTSMIRAGIYPVHVHGGYAHPCRKDR